MTPTKQEIEATINRLRALIEQAVRDEQLRHQLTYVEAAVAFAKRQGRNRVARYDPSMTKLPTVSSRADCAACQAAFSFDVAAARVGSEDLYCPNCGERGARPATAGFPPSPVDITDR